MATFLRGTFLATRQRSLASCLGAFPMLWLMLFLRLMLLLGALCWGFLLTTECWLSLTGWLHSGRA